MPVSRRCFVRPAMRASSLSRSVQTVSPQASATPYSSGSIGGLSATSCWRVASSSRRFRSGAVAAPEWPTGGAGLDVDPDPLPLFRRPSAVFPSAALANFMTSTRSTRYTPPPSSLNRARSTVPPAGPPNSRSRRPGRIGSAPGGERGGLRASRASGRRGVFAFRNTRCGRGGRRRVPGGRPTVGVDEIVVRLAHPGLGAGVDVPAAANG